MKMKTGKEMILKGITNFVFGLFGLICLLLFLFSVFETSRVNIAEQITYHKDFPVLHILFLLAVCIAFVYFKRHFCRRVPSCILYAAVCTAMLLWVLATLLYPKADQMFIMEICPHIAQENYQDFLPGGYLYNQPHQIFLTYFSTVLYLIFGERYIFVFQILNCAAAAGVFYLLQKLYEKYEKTDDCSFFPLICFLFLPFVFYVTFVYGTIIGLFCALAALIEFCLYLENSRVFHMVLCTFFILLAQLLKSNYLIFLVAFLAVLVFDFLKRFKLGHLVFMCLLTGSLLLCNYGITAFTENLTGIHSEGGIPKELFIAMGLKDSNSAPGWWSGYHNTVFVHQEFDVEASKKIGMRKIKKQLNKMKKDPLYGVDFFCISFCRSGVSQPTRVSGFSSSATASGICRCLQIGWFTTAEG